MKTATFYFREMQTNGTLTKVKMTRKLLMSFDGGILVEWDNRPQGKCIADENIISINN